MSKLSQAPLIEAIFELRWGQTIALPDGQQALQFSDDETGFFFGQFKAAAKERGFPHIERANPAIADVIPHVVIHRFRKSPSAWPCYQIGQGVFSVNQLNDGYDWTSFKAAIIHGLEILKAGYTGDFENMPVIGYELRYQDAYLFNAQEKPLEFLQSKFNINLDISDEFRRHPGLKEDIFGTSLAFQLNTVNPNGVLIFSLNEGLINRAPGFITNTVVRSMNSHCPKSDSDIAEWLERAHDLQKHAFTNFTKPAFQKTLK